MDPEKVNYHYCDDLPTTPLPGRYLLRSWPVFSAKDIMNIENFNAYLKFLVNGSPVEPFNIEAMRPPQGNPDIVEKIKELSYLKYGRDRAEIEDEIMRKYQK